MCVLLVMKFGLCRLTYNTMPGKLKVRIMAAHDLPVMDRASELTDAFAEVCNCTVLNNKHITVAIFFCCNGFTRAYA